ncbi:MAG: YiiD C-terminal domain-containing protein [Bdellovibrionales bacterium]
MQNLTEKYLDDLLNSIPVVKSLDVDVDHIGGNTVSLKAPLSTHINYEGTAFGGSINTLCVLSSYLLVHHLLKNAKLPFSHLVIQDSSIKYLYPVDKDFKATAKSHHRGS